MLALLLVAFITLPGADPDVQASPVPHIGQQFSGDALATGTSPDGTAASGLGLSLCTYGPPLVGSNLFADASQLDRTMTLPQCASGLSGFGTAGFGSGFGDPFGYGAPGGFGGPFGFSPFGLAGAIPMFYTSKAPYAGPPTLFGTGHRANAPTFRLPAELPMTATTERRASAERGYAQNQQQNQNRVPQHR